jgi:serine/threonine protein kinase
MVKEMKCPICGFDNPPNATNCRKCGASLDASSMFVTLWLPVGTTLRGGAFTVGKFLGQGGFGITYKGSHRFLGRVVAIKELFPNGCGRRGTSVILPPQFNIDEYTYLKQRFIQEARILARFNHPGIPNIYDVFEENNTAYYVMEFIEGETLENIVNRKGRLDEDEAVRYIIGVGEVLEVVHSSGILHRDIKPSNIMIGRDGRVKLIDFGSAKDLAKRTKTFTMCFISPPYAPPEQFSTQSNFGPFTDVYALAATLFYLLTGMEPPTAQDRYAGQPLPDVRQLNPRVSERVAEAVKLGMELNSSKRPQTIREFISLLSRPTPIRASATTGSGVSPATSKSPEPSPPSEDEEKELTPLKNIIGNLYALTEKLKDENLFVEFFHISLLEQGTAQTYTCQLMKGEEYIILGAGDGVVILDLNSAIYSPSDKVLAEDVLTDNFPVLRFKTREEGAYRIKAWAEDIKGEEGYYCLVVGRRIKDRSEKEAMNTWRSIFDKFLALSAFNAAMHIEIIHAELDRLSENTKRTLSAALDKGYEYFIIASGDVMNIVDLDMVVNLPDGEELEDKGPDNNPSVNFRLDEDGVVKITTLPARMQAGKEWGYYMLYIGRRR